MTKEAYCDIIEQVGKLDTDEQLRLLEDLAVLVRKRVEGRQSQRNIMELEGLGAHLWQDPETGDMIDAQEYVNQERQAWQRSGIR